MAETKPVVNTPPKKASKMISVPDDCAAGSHVFIVSAWKTETAKKSAIHMMCQHCLMPIEYNGVSQDWVVNREWLKKAD